MFRYKQGVPVSYNRQGYIYFVSRLFRELPERDQIRIRNLCLECAGPEYDRALLEFVTTNADATYIERKYHVSKSTLYRCVRAYYVRFPRKL